MKRPQAATKRLTMLLLSDYDDVLRFGNRRRHLRQVDGHFKKVLRNPFGRRRIRDQNGIKKPGRLLRRRCDLAEVFLRAVAQGDPRIGWIGLR
jgi:hypothetical protein